MEGDGASLGGDKIIRPRGYRGVCPVSTECFYTTIILKRITSQTNMEFVLDIFRSSSYSIDLAYLLEA